MLKITPQKCLIDFLDGSYTNKNNKFLIPVYEKLFKDIGERIDITKDFKHEAKDLKDYFSYVNKIKEENDINLKDNTPNKKELVDKFIALLDKNKIKKAVKALKKICIFLSENRSNINGLEIISWSLFGGTTLENIKNVFVNNIKVEENIKNALLSFDFNCLIMEYDDFSDVMINDLLIPVELKNPKRRQGFFDKEVFRLISIEIKKCIEDFKFETEIEEKNVRFLNENTNWLITEKITKKIELPLPKNAKKIDMICKIDKLLFIGTHKEQQAVGGAQDNQAVDASFLFDYKRDDLEKIKEIFNVGQVYLCIFLERGGAKITSSHWKKIIKIVKNKNNENKYLLSGFQFIELIKAEKKLIA